MDLDNGVQALDPFSFWGSGLISVKPPQLGGPNYGFFAVVAFALAGLAIAAQVFLFAETDTPDPCTMPNNNCSS